jgi:IPT/TIG domain
VVTRCIQGRTLGNGYRHPGQVGLPGSATVTIADNDFPPKTSGVTPNSGPLAGGTRFVVMGSGFEIGARVLIVKSTASVHAVVDNSVCSNLATGYGRFGRAALGLYGLQQDMETRANLALVNTGETDASPSVFCIELYDGASGQKVNTVDGITVNSRRWLQIGNILAQYSPE